MNIIGNKGNILRRDCYDKDLQQINSRKYQKSTNVFSMLYVSNHKNYYSFILTTNFKN